MMNNGNRQIRLVFTPGAVTSIFDGCDVLAYRYRPDQWRGAMKEARFRHGRGELVKIERVCDE